MIFQEKDIDYSKIDWQTFEELCFELLLKYHFHSLIWRQGGHDKGRDIEAWFTVTNPIIDIFQEKWFIECKHHKGGLKVAEISEKIDWAKAEKADHFLLMSTSYLTDTARDWLDKQKGNLLFSVHELHGKALKAKLLAFPDLVIKYFFSDGMAVSEMLKLWVLYDNLPNAKSFNSTMKKADPGKLKLEHLVFLLYCQSSLSDELEQFYKEEGQEELDDKLLFRAIVQNIGSCKFQFSEQELRDMDIRPHFLGRLTNFQRNSDKRMFFLREKYKGHFLLELYLEKHNQKMDYKAALRRIRNK